MMTGESIGFYSFLIYLLWLIDIQYKMAVVLAK